MTSAIVGWSFTGWLLGGSDLPKPARSSDAGLTRSVPDPDEALATRIGDGDISAFTTVFERYYTPLVRMAARYVGSMDAAEDVAQETFLRLWEGRATIDLTRSLKGYLFVTARNRARDIAKHHHVVRHHIDQSVTRYVAEPSAMPVAPAADEATLADELAAVVEKHLATLTPRQREIFALSRHDGLTAQEIGAMLGIATQTVYVQLARIIPTLFPLLAPWLNRDE